MEKGPSGLYDAAHSGDDTASRPKPAISSRHVAVHGNCAPGTGTITCDIAVLFTRVRLTCDMQQERGDAAALKRFAGRTGGVFPATTVMTTVTQFGTWLAAHA